MALIPSNHITYHRSRNILERMKLLFDEYRFVKLYRDTVYEISKNNPKEFRQAHKRTVPTTIDIISVYEKKYGITNLESEDICTQAVQDQYLEVETSDQGNPVLSITSKGRELIDTFPIGFLEELFKKRPQLYGFISGLAVAGVLALFKWLF